MNAFGTITRAGFGWLTAVMTLVAGLPHFQCQCPNGSVKPFCFGVFCSSSGCCCGDACSPSPKDTHGNPKAAPPRKGRLPCCGAAHCSQSKPKPSDGRPRVEGRGCQRSLAQQQHLAPSVQAKAPDDTGAPASAVLIPTALSSLASARSAADVNCLHLAAPPPPDLVILLQRFVI